MIKEKIISILFFLSISFVVIGQIPAGYYDSASGLSGVALQQALHNIIDNHNTVSYDNLHDYYDDTDKKPNGKVWDVYSDNPGGTPPYEFSFTSGDQCGNYSQEGDCYNREHIWPKSWYGGEVMPMFSDMFLVYPTDGYVNGRRSSYPYGEVGSSSWISQNGSKLGSCISSGYSQTVFEPIDEYKGDLARSYFYMSVRYYNEDSGWPGSDMADGAELEPWALALMLQWDDNDPVSQKEIDRNNDVHDIQNNRNPFIDHPEWVDAIWDPSSVIEKTSNNRITLHPNPVKNELNINGHFSGNSIKIEIFNIVGNRLFSNTFSNQKYKFDKKINVEKLNKGIYFLKIYTKENTTTKKFIID